jgi:hypothetical protein
MNRWLLSTATLLIATASVAACTSDDEDTSTGTPEAAAGADQGGAATEGGASNGGAVTGGTTTEGGAPTEGGAAPQGGAGGAGTAGGAAGATAGGATAGGATAGGATAGGAGGALPVGGAAGAGVVAGGAGGALPVGGAAGAGVVAGGAGGAAPDTGNLCESDADCIDGATCYEGVCVLSGGGLRISLSWEGISDLDLHVLTPAEDEIYWGEPTGGGGVLDVDDCAYYADEEVFDCKDAAGTHVENVYFEDPASGDYYFVVDGFQTDGPVEFTVTVFSNDVESDSWTGTVDMGDYSDEYSVTVP